MNHGLRFPGVEGEGFLTEHGLVRVQAQQRVIVVHGMGGGHVDRVDIRGFRQGLVGFVPPGYRELVGESVRRITRPRPHRHHFRIRTNSMASANCGNAPFEYAQRIFSVMFSPHIGVVIGPFENRLQRGTCVFVARVFRNPDCFWRDSPFM